MHICLHEVFTRRDQLCLRAGKKQENAETKGTKKNQKSDQTGEVKKPESRKKSAKNPEKDDETNGEDGQGKRKRNEREASTEEGGMTAKSKAAAKAKGKPSTKSNAKGKSKSAEEKPKKKRKTQENEKDQGKTHKAEKQKPAKKTAEKAKKPRAQSAKTSEVDVEAHPELQTEIASWVNDNIDYKDLDVLKKTVKAARLKFDYFRLNIYWTTFKCGLTMRKVGEKDTDVACFSFNDKSLRGCAVAIACAEHLVI